jgi:DNA-binding NarL/FixJ family response regulator
LWGNETFDVDRERAAGESTMTDVRVGIFSPDRLRHAGITAMLENAEGLSTRPFQVNQRHDVIVVVANDITKDRIKPVTLAWRLFDTPSVVIADERIEFDADAAADAGVVSAMHLRDATTERVADAVRRAADIGVGSAARPDGLISQVLRIQRYPVDHDAKPDLSQSEIVVLRQFAAGSSTLEVARDMQLSERTVKYLLWRLMQRFDLHNRAHAVAFAIRAGVI